MSEKKAEGRKIYKRRKLHHLKSSIPMFAQVKPEFPLSGLLNRCDMRGQDRLILCGPLDAVSREYVEEPLGEWEFARKYIHKYRSPVYRRAIDGTEGAKISVKLASESWFPCCESVGLAESAWAALAAEWRSTALPLMSTPATTGMALLWETLPHGDGFPALPDDLARHIRRISPQHRKQRIVDVREMTIDEALSTELFCYDGRFMYAAQCLKDRYPVGEPRKVGGFREYQPGFYDVTIQIPKDWDHIGLIPVPDYYRAEQFGTLGWKYPFGPGEMFRAWVAEPELSFATREGWEIIELHDGWAFDKGRPLDVWAKKLIVMRERLQELERTFVPPFEHYGFASAAVREILTNTIGRLHKNTVEREAHVEHFEWREMIQKWGYANVRTIEKFEDGCRLVEYPEPNPSDFMIFMPHWSATLYSLARVEVLKYALRIPVDHLIEIDGDAIYTSERQQWIEDEDKDKIGQLRRKE